MGVMTDYGLSKNWYYGLTFDGMNKETNASDATFGVGSGPNDYLFAQDKQVASHMNAGATATGTMTITFHPTALAIGHSTATIIRRIGGADGIYFRTREWCYGLTSTTLNKNSFSGQQFWRYGSVDAEIYPAGQVGLAIAGASAAGTMRITFHPTALAIGQASATVVRKIGGITDPQGGQKFWSAGQAFGLTFFALSNSFNTTNKNKFADQSLWYFGIATPDMVGTAATPVVTTNPAKQLGPNMMTKNRSVGWPTNVKVISAAIPNKRTSASS